MRRDQIRIAQQVPQRVGKALGLIELGSRNRAAGADDGVARADQNIGCAVDRPGAILEFADEAIVQAAERVFLASARSRSENSRHTAIDRSRTSGSSIRLNQPMNRVARRRGMRLVNRKLMSSRSNIRRTSRLIVMGL